MKEDYVSFETAKLLKEKGFNEFTRTGWGAYDSKEEPRNFIPDDGRGGWYDTKKEWLSRPTLQMATKWLREVHNIHITIDCDICDSFDFYSTIRIKSEESWKTYVEYEDEGSNTYEEAAEKAVKYCLTNLI